MKQDYKLPFKKVGISKRLLLRIALSSIAALCVSVAVCNNKSNRHLSSSSSGSFSTASVEIENVDRISSTVSKSLASLNQPAQPASSAASAAVQASTVPAVIKPLMLAKANVTSAAATSPATKSSVIATSAKVADPKVAEAKKVIDPKAEGSKISQVKDSSQDSNQDAKNGNNKDKTKDKDQLSAKEKELVKEKAQESAVATQKQASLKNSVVWRSVKVKAGDTLEKIFKRQGYSNKDLQDILAAANAKNKKQLTALQPGQTLKLLLEPGTQKGVRALALDLKKGTSTKTVTIAKLGVNLKALDLKAAESKITADATKKTSDKSVSPNLILAVKGTTGTSNAASNATRLKIKETILGDESTAAAAAALNKDLSASYASDPSTSFESSQQEDHEEKKKQDIKAVAGKLSDKQIAFGKGTITPKGSFIASAKKAGLDQSVMKQMTDIFKSSVDLSFSLKPADKFRVLFEEKRSADGERVRTGAVIAAEVTTAKGKTYQAVRYTDKTGRTDYFSPDGNGLRPSFLAYPVNFTRISSRMTDKRFHPILHKMTKHNGTDYAAPAGTPVVAMADGKVLFQGRQGGYGNVIELQHDKNITTLYAHLSRIDAKAKKTGQRVKQGDVIGYVGRTGLATGNHLHFELKEGGIYRDPHTFLRPKKSSVITDSNRQHFLAHAKAMFRLMDIHESKVSVARNEFPKNE